MAGSSRYARTEREHRFLLPGVPDLPAGLAVRRIEDRYLDRTRLRLRAVREDGPSGAPPVPPVFKLGQKIRPDPGRPSTVAHTSLYLDGAEYDLLRVLPGRDLAKTRTVLAWAGLAVAVDVFTGRLAGLVLAEVDLGDTGVMPGPLPLPWLAEVTADERFTGGVLAATDRTALDRMLSAHGVAAVPPPPRT